MWSAREGLGGLPEGPAGAEGAQVGLQHGGALGELLRQEPLGLLRGPLVQPAQQAQGEHVLAALGVLAGQPEVLQRLDRHRLHRQRVHPVALEAAVLQRGGAVADLGEVARGEVVGVDDERAAGPDVVDVRAQRRGVHGHEDVGGVPGGGDVVVGEVQLEAGDAGQGAGGGADLGGEVGQRRQVVAQAAVSAVKRSPVSCMPSPESPAKRMTRSTRSSVSHGLGRSRASRSMLRLLRRPGARCEAGLTRPSGRCRERRGTITRCR